MTLSEKIYNKKDFKPVKGMFGSPSGYEVEDVELFLDEVVAEVEKMEKEIENLQLQIRNLMEESRIDQEVLHTDEAEEITDLKENLKRRIEQFETLNRAKKELFVSAEEIAHNMKKEAKETAQVIIEEAKNQANGLMKKVEERCTEKQLEIKRLEEEEKRLRDQFGQFAKLIESAVSKN